MNIEEIVLMIFGVLGMVRIIYVERRDRDKYCTCNADDDFLFIHGYCQECGKSDGNWYP